MPTCKVQPRALARALIFASTLACALAVAPGVRAQLMDADVTSSNPSSAQQSLNSSGVSSGQALNSLSPSNVPAASSADSGDGVFLSETGSAPPTVRSTSHAEDFRVGDEGSSGLVAQNQAIVLPVPEWTTSAMAICSLALLGFVAAARRALRRQTPGA